MRKGSWEMSQCLIAHADLPDYQFQFQKPKWTGFKTSPTTRSRWFHIVPGHPLFTWASPFESKHGETYYPSDQPVIQVILWAITRQSGSPRVRPGPISSWCFQVLINLVWKILSHRQVVTGGAFLDYVHIWGYLVSVATFIINLWCMEKRCSKECIQLSHGPWITDKVSVVNHVSSVFTLGAFSGVGGAGAAVFPQMLILAIYSLRRHQFYEVKMEN